MYLSRQLTQDDMQAAITELDQALYAHEQWLEDVSAALICKLKADDRDLADDAHRKCRFGQWYYGSGLSALSDRAGFAEVETEHKRMHQYAASMLRATQTGTPISLQDYERFVSALKRMRLEIDTLKHELEVALYNIDPLTGVPGRLQMLQKLRENHTFVTRDVHPCTIAMLDVDKFKSVNDDYGHLVGDKVLQSIASYVQAHLRQYDILFRYGGEEFLICMPEADEKAAFEICERLRAELAGIPYHTDDNNCFQVTVSIGIAALSADHSVEEAILRADQALLAAKTAGRNRVLVWEPSIAANHAAA